MKVSVHQPSYFPWLGLLDKIAKSDLYILMDSVQLADRAYQHRNVFLAKDGNVKYLTVSIEKKGYREKAIKDILVAANGWQKKHRNFLIENYGKSHSFDEIFESIKHIYMKEYKFLIDALADSMACSFELFGIKTKLKFQSELEYNQKAKRSDLVLSLVKSVNSDVYISGMGAVNYLNIQDFRQKGINVVFNEVKLPRYPQKGISDDSFVEGLSCLDMLFNLGIIETRKLFWKSVKEERQLVG